MDTQIKDQMQKKGHYNSTTKMVTGGSCIMMFGIFGENTVPSDHSSFKGVKSSKKARREVEKDVEKMDLEVENPVLVGEILE